MKNLLKRWPILWLIFPLTILLIASGPALAWLDQWIRETTGEESMVPLSTLVILCMGLFAWMASADLSFAAIKFNLKWLWFYYLDDAQCKKDFYDVSPSQRQWLLFAYLALFMLTFAIIIAQV
jgi:hypothetical protein